MGKKFVFLTKSIFLVQNKNVSNTIWMFELLFLVIINFTIYPSHKIFTKEES